MKNRKLWIVFSSQEVATANHIDFWRAIANKEENADILIIDIFADMVISRIKNKSYRIKDHKNGMKKLSSNLFVFRPMTFIRPELLPEKFKIGAMKKVVKQLENIVDDFEDREKNILYYDCRLTSALSIFEEKCKKVYFIYDEVYLNASNGEEIKGLKEMDYRSCQNSNLILTMTDVIASRRSEFIGKMITLGNGAATNIKAEKTIKLQKSIGFIGNFRNWIDLELLKNLITSREDYMFCFAGPIEENMKDEFEKILNNHKNTIYFGKISKMNVKSIYSMLDVVIVPYKANNHIRSTRPIKIVESVFNRTPVVTVPMDGYKESMFIKFARNEKEFLKEIDFFIEKEIDFNNKEYQSFVMENSWDAKASMLIEKLEEF